MTRDRKIIDQAIRRELNLPTNHQLTSEDRQRVRVLYLGYNQITDVSPLAELTHLKWLDLDDNPVTNRDALEIVRML